ncbi:hypothetical protein AB0N73_14695 [Microbacterium sp. NPDC089189]|uniref:hypothetical protein n=1 Tax=Microbacterium sp. NPDC089189 TaxID=3154972 RepID=UPI003429F915
MRARLLRVGALAAASAALATLVLSLALTPALAADDETGGIGISVPVLGPPAPHAPSAVRPADVATTAPVATDTPAPELAASDVLIAGGLYLSDVTGASSPTLDPFQGKTELWVTLRNLSEESIDASALFSMSTVAGSHIDDRKVAVVALKPGESRVVGATLEGSGQWPLVVGRVTIEPPATIDGQQTAPVHRAAVVWVFPWLVTIGVLLVALALVLLHLSSRVFAAPPVPAPSAA